MRVVILLLLFALPAASDPQPEFYWQHPAADVYLQPKPKPRRVADWEFILAMGLLQGATVADIESTIAGVRDPSLGLSERNSWKCGRRPGRGCLYAVDTAFNAGFGVVTYYLKRALTDRGRRKDKARLWAWPVAMLTVARANAARENYRLIDTQRGRLQEGK